MATMGQSTYFGLPGYRQQPFFAQDGTNKNLKIQVKSLKHRFLIEVSVLHLIRRVRQIRAVRSGCNASSRTICYCRHHVGNVSCTQGLLRSLVPTVRNSKGSELRDPGKGRNDIHDVDGACSGLWASQGC